MQLRKGDKVSVIGTVKFDPDGKERIFVTVDGSHDDLWLDPKFVKLVQAKFEVGDEVEWAGMEDEPETICKGTIQALDDTHAWIKMDDGDYCTRRLGSINRTPWDDKDV